VVEPAEHGERRDRTGEAGRDAFTRNRNPLTEPWWGPACVAKRPHHSFCKLDSRCGKLADAEHRAIRAKPRAIIKGLFCRRSRAIVQWRREVAKTAGMGDLPAGLGRGRDGALQGVRGEKSAHHESGEEREEGRKRK
jgi:hypothetical protein